jgi:hypothetical protein
VVISTTRPGIYLVDPGRRDELGRQLAEGKVRLTRLLDRAAGGTEDRIERDRLVLEIRRLERELAEAEEALAAEAAPDRAGGANDA